MGIYLFSCIPSLSSGKESLLHFVAFFHVASLLSTGVDKEKALELTNSTVFHRGRQWKSSRAGQHNIFFSYFRLISIWKCHPKCNKTSCCIVVWSRQTFWFKLNFLLPKNESVLNILVYLNWFHLQTTRKFCWQPEISGWIQASTYATKYYCSILSSCEWLSTSQWDQMSSYIFMTFVLIN